MSKIPVVSTQYELDIVSEATLSPKSAIAGARLLVMGSPMSAESTQSSAPSSHPPLLLASSAPVANASSVTHDCRRQPP